MTIEQRLSQLRIDWRNAKTEVDRRNILNRAKLLLKAIKKG